MSPEVMIQSICVAALPMLLAITVHEAAHAYIAKVFGDKTAWMLGRVTLNPIKHIDPVGTIIVPLICLLLPGSFLFGWAKPVPVNVSALRHPKRDMIWVAAAGPMSNLIMAFVWALMLFKLNLQEDSGFFASMFRYGVIINLGLMALNLLPLLPLDGGRIVAGLLPRKLANEYAKIEPYGFYILIGLSVFHVLNYLMQPLVMAGFNLIAWLLL